MSVFDTEKSVRLPSSRELDRANPCIWEFVCFWCRTRVSSTELALSLVFSQSEFQLLFLMYVPPISQCFSNLASLLKRVSRCFQGLQSQNSVAVRARAARG